MIRARAISEGGVARWRNCGHRCSWGERRRRQPPSLWMLRDGRPHFAHIWFNGWSTDLAPGVGPWAATVDSEMAPERIGRILMEWCHTFSSAPTEESRRVDRRLGLEVFQQQMRCRAGRRHTTREVRVCGALRRSCRFPLGMIACPWYLRKPRICLRVRSSVRDVLQRVGLLVCARELGGVCTAGRCLSG